MFRDAGGTRKRPAHPDATDQRRRAQWHAAAGGAVWRRSVGSLSGGLSGMVGCGTGSAKLGQVTTGNMDRTKIILEGIGKEALGIEVAPWLAPVAARRDGYNVRIIDVFDTETLRSRGPADPHQADRDLGLLEEVDWVGSATEIATLVPADLHGKIDYIVSSHNFEHLANPIKFLNGCATVLRPGGILTMAVPDRRGCFDFFRPHTVIGDWIEAFREDRQRPTPRQVFDSKSMSAELRRGDETFHAFHLGENARDIGVTGKLLPQFAVWEAARPADEYTDAHCTVMTPGSLELLLFEARALGLITLETVSLRETDTFEF